MKKIVFLLFAAGYLSVSCSSDDNNSSNTSAGVYLPVNTGDYWVYNTENSTTTGRDSLYIAKDTVIGLVTYKKFKTKNIATGFYSRALSNNGVRNLNGKLLVSGSTSFSFSEAAPLSVSVSDFTFFDAGASSGKALDETSGTITQATEDGYDIKIDYTLSSAAGTNLATFTTSGGVTYNDVKTSKLTLNLAITAIVKVSGISIPFTVMQPQDAVVSTQYYAKNIGAVYAVTDISYALSDLSSLNITLPIPSSGSEHQEEILANYHLNQ